MSKNSTTSPPIEHSIRPPAADRFDAARAIKRPPIWSWIGSVVVLILLAQAGHFVANNPAFAWPVVWEYFTSQYVLQGLATTLQLTAVCMALGILGGMVLAAMRLSSLDIS
jgi:polar amino acid transport system permease protein